MTLTEQRSREQRAGINVIIQNQGCNPKNKQNTHTLTQAGLTPLTAALYDIIDPESPMGLNGDPPKPGNSVVS